MDKAALIIRAFVIVVLTGSAARADGFTVQHIFGQGVFYSNATGQLFSPRGANYVRLVPMTMPWATQAGPYDQHVTLDPNYYDRARLQLALRQMQASGYNIVRLTLDCPFLATANASPANMPILAYDNGVAIPALASVNGLAAPGIPKQFLGTLEDALSLIALSGMKAMLSYASIPVNYLPNEDYNNNNLMLGLGPLGLDPTYVAARARFWSDLLIALPRPYWKDIFSVDVADEITFDLTSAPFKRGTGTYAFGGVSYDLADYNVNDANSRQALADAATADFADTVAKAIKQVDPDMLVSISQYSPYAVGHPDFDGLQLSPANVQNNEYGYPLRPSVLLNTALDFIDFHQYPPGPVATVDIDLQSAGISQTGVWPKPLLMSEFGLGTGQRAGAGTGLDGFGRTATPAVAQQAVGRLAQTCGYGFSGWVFWSWDATNEAPGYLTLTQNGGAINEAISPATNPTICQPIPAGIFVAAAPAASGDTIFYSNGHLYCAYQTWAGFLSLTGMSAAAASAFLAPMLGNPYRRVPPTMAYDGTCSASTAPPLALAAAPPPSPPTFAANFISTVNGASGIYYASASAYCWYDSVSSFESISGMSGSAFTDAVAAMSQNAYTSTPTALTYTGACRSNIPAGFFVYSSGGNDGIFYSNGSQYCGFNTWAYFLSLTGMTSAAAAAEVEPMIENPYTNIPTTMVYGGICGGS